MKKLKVNVSTMHAVGRPWTQRMRVGKATFRMADCVCRWPPTDFRRVTDLSPAGRPNRAMDGLRVCHLPVQELKEALAERGLDTTGLKPVLVERLEAALQQQNGAAAAPNGTAEAAEEPLVDITAPDTAIAEAPVSAPAGPVSSQSCCQCQSG